jgi:hypothetical protein
MRKPKKSELGKDYRGAAAGGRSPLHQNPYYTGFFRNYAEAMNTIFYAQAAAMEIPDPVLQIMIRRTRDRVGLVFVTSTEVTASKDGLSVTTGTPDPQSDDLFGHIHSVLGSLAKDKPGVRVAQIGQDGSGAYEIDIKEPREALQLLLDFLHENEAISADLEVGKTYTPPTQPQLTGSALPDHFIRYLPQQTFLSATKALEAEQIIAASGNVYPFSLNYMEALLEQAEKDLPKRSAALEQHLSAYRWH